MNYQRDAGTYSLSQVDAITSDSTANNSLHFDPRSCNIYMNQEYGAKAMTPERPSVFIIRGVLVLDERHVWRALFMSRISERYNLSDMIDRLVRVFVKLTVLANSPSPRMTLVRQKS